jgi:F-type H+-transporting ATPase subunit delta
MAENITIARPYAQAVFDLARDQKAFDQWSGMLELLSAVVTDPQLIPVIGNPRVSGDGLVTLIIDVCGDGLTEQGRSLVRVLAENRRLELLPEMRALYEAMRAEAEQLVQAEVVSAFPLTDEQKKGIAGALSRRLGRQVQLTCETDEALIGGAVIRAGDLVIDGSVAAHVNRLASALTR